MKSAFLFATVFYVSSLVYGQNAQDLFHRRLALREAVNEQNQLQTKAQMTALRYQEDVLIEAAHGNNRIGVSEKSGEAFKTGVTLVNPEYGKVVTFKSGDVILLRGTTTISTSIASMTDTATQFSHALMVYVNSQTKEAFGIEALIDKGVIVRPLKEILTEGVPRMVLFRHGNETVADAAGKIAYDKAQDYIQKGTTYPYDFKFDLGDYTNVYCFEYIRMAYDLATKGTTKVPQYTSKLGDRFKNTIDSLKVDFKPIDIFGPADLDTERFFDLVAEWRDPAATVNYRIKDQIVLSVFEGIEKGALVVDYSKLKALAAGGQGAPANGEVPVSSKLNSVAEGVNTVVNELAGAVLIANDKQLAATHRNMTAQEISDFIQSMMKLSEVQSLLKRNSFISRSCKGPLKGIAP